MCNTPRPAVPAEHPNPGTIRYFADRLVQQYDRASEILFLIEKDMDGKIAEAEAGNDRIESGNATGWYRALLFVRDGLEGDIDDLRKALKGEG